MNNKNLNITMAGQKYSFLITELNKSFNTFTNLKDQFLGENVSVESYLECQFDDFEQEIYGEVFHKLNYFFFYIENGRDDHQTDLEFCKELLTLLPARGENILEYVGLDKVEEISDRWGVEEDSPQDLLDEYFDDVGEQIIWLFITFLTSKLINFLNLNKQLNKNLNISKNTL